MASLSKKDRKILTAIVVMVLGFVVWSFGIEPVYSNYEELNERLESAEETYIRNQETLAEANSIDEGYARVEAQFPQDDPEDADRDPGEKFNEEVIDLVQEQVGTIPAYSPPVTAEIKGAVGYEFLILPLSVKTTLDKAAKMLAEFERKGYLIQTAKITRETDLNKDDLTVDLNLGRIVKIAEEDTDEGGTGTAPGGLKLQRGRR